MVLFYGLHPIFTNYPRPHYGHSPHMPTVTEHPRGHTECWEADDNGNEFYDKTVDTLRLIGDI
jgi:hypothetical protein